MSARTDVLLWAQRIIALAGSPPHQLLEIKADAGIEDAQEAFHKIARTSHPDLHRTGLAADELERVTLAYARIAGAYQDFRSQRMQTTRIRPIKDAPTPVPGIPTQRTVRPTPTAGSPPLTSTGAPTSGVPTTPGSAASGAMNSKALIYYRKAELALRRGDLKNALMQMKMAIAGDPQSQLLRNALLEIEAELAKT
ncbi:MAG: hypothetical protein JWP01_2793 [Myxococcales bacterium]|nr:hypothetical protein [Myxococcales bacterium]